MGRKKAKMVLIPDKKSRNLTFKKRKEGLIRKMHELTILCDVTACAVIYGPDADAAADPEIWPPHDAAEVRRMVDLYKVKSRESGSKTYGLADFFHDRKRRVDVEVEKLRRGNMEARFPAWFSDMDSMSEAELRVLAGFLSVKAEAVRSRIGMLREDLYGGGGTELQVMNVPNDVALPVQYYQMLPDSGDRNLMMNGCNQFVMNGGGDQFVQCGEDDQQVVYETTAAVDQSSVAWCYAPPLTVAPYTMQQQDEALLLRNYDYGF